MTCLRLEGVDGRAMHIEHSLDWLALNTLDAGVNSRVNVLQQTNVTSLSTCEPNQLDAWPKQEEQ